MSDYRRFKLSTSYFISRKKIHLFSQGFSNFHGYVVKVVANLAPQEETEQDWRGKIAETKKKKGNKGIKRPKKRQTKRVDTRKRREGRTRKQSAKELVGKFIITLYPYIGKLGITATARI